MRYLLLTYYKQANGKIDECMTVSNKIKPRDWQTTNVILDFKKLEVLKCSMDGVQVPKEWDKITSYYYQHYANVFERLFKENGHELVYQEATPEKTNPN